VGSVNSSNSSTDSDEERKGCEVVGEINGTRQLLRVNVAASQSA